MQFTDILRNLKFHYKSFDIFLIFAENIDCGYTLEPHRQGGSNEYPQSMFWSKNKNQRTNGPVNAHLRSAILTKYLFKKNALYGAPPTNQNKGLGQQTTKL